MIQQGDAVASLMKVVCSRQSGQSCAENEDGVWRGGCHENRERSQTRRAMITR